MTAKEMIQSKSFLQQLMPIYDLKTVIKLMQDFATIKCKEQRENCAEEAQVYLDHNDIPFVSKGSILQAKQPEV